MGHGTNLGVSIESDMCGGTGSPLPGFMFCASIIQVYGQILTEKLSSSSISNKPIFYSTALHYFFSVLIGRTFGNSA